MQFPKLSGSNLLRQKINLPDDLEGELKIIFIAFQQWQQTLIDAWVPAAQRLEQDFAGVRFYEIPVIYKMNFLARTFINEGMRAGLPNPTTRQKTITLYTDKQALRAALDISTEETIWVLLLDQSGQVVWRTQGAYSPEQGEALLNAIQAQVGMPGAAQPD